MDYLLTPVAVILVKQQVIPSIVQSIGTETVLPLLENGVCLIKNLTDVFCYTFQLKHSLAGLDVHKNVCGNIRFESL